MVLSRNEVREAIGGTHDFRLFDHSKPAGPQFEDVDVVVDHGGLVGTREMADLAAGRVKLWQVLGTGMDHFDVAYWKEKNIPLANCPGTTAGAGLADLAMMFILMLTRSYPMAPRALRENLYNEPLGRDPSGLTLGLIGFGASAKDLAKRALPFGFRIRVIDTRDIGDAEKRKFGLDYVGKPENLDSVIAVSDFLSLHLHLNDETRHLIDRRRLGLMKPDACLINVARSLRRNRPTFVHHCSNWKTSSALITVPGSLTVRHAVAPRPRSETSSALPTGKHQ
jgi:lactate dehydrogenase-like 2-hydroxyacid dehydrogenase